MSVNLFVSVLMSIFPSLCPYICLYVHWYVHTAVHTSMCPLGHLGVHMCFVRHPGVCQYNYLFIHPAVAYRLTIVCRAYLMHLNCMNILGAVGLHPPI